MDITIERVKKCRVLTQCDPSCRKCVDFLISEYDRLTTELKAAHMHIDRLSEGKQEELKKAEEIAKRETARECREIVISTWEGDCVEEKCLETSCARCAAKAINEKYGLGEE